MKMRKLTGFILTLGIILGIQLLLAGSAGKIAGVVIDSENKQPIPGRVIVESTTMGANVNPFDGSFLIENVPPGVYTLVAECIGYEKKSVKNVRVKADSTTTLNIELVAESIELGEVLVYAERPVIDKYEVSTVDRVSSDEIANLPISNIKGIIKTETGFVSKGDAMHIRGSRAGEFTYMGCGSAIRDPLGGYGFPNYVPGQFHTEEYDRIYENEFLDVINNPLSTFSIDVDAASYSNIRRFISSGSLPPKDAVRTEELINYFNYDYPQPTGGHPFSITTEISSCPWNSSHRLAHIGLQGKNIHTEDIPPGNLVFLIDVSGSMRDRNKLPLLKLAFRLLIEQLREDDRVAIVVYAGAAGLVLPSTPGYKKEIILQAIDRLRAGGSTAGSQGIKLAYETAVKNFIKQGINRVILATDGDFNVGVSSDGELVRLIEEKRKQNVFLSVLGFGTGNYKDSKMEKLADKGNGNYSYIDNIFEAKKVLVDQLGGTLYTIAKDVKIQIEFNPVKVAAYRLIGYENRILAAEDFNDDKKDAGELGAGHTVTALYEIIPSDSKEELAQVDTLKYQRNQIKPEAYENPELMAIKFRYKPPEDSTSRLIVNTVIDHDYALKRTSDNFRFSAAVAEFSLILRDSKFKGDASFEQILDLAINSRGEDTEGYRSEFIQLVEVCKALVSPN